MNTLVLVLRLLHIGAGVFWVGAALFSTFYLTPAVVATGEAGQKVMARLIEHARISARMTAASTVTVLAGAGLYWIDAQGFTSSWWTSGPGIGFGLGALAAILGMGAGQMVGSSAAKVGKLAAQASGGVSAEQAAAIQKARKAMASASTISTILLIVALVCMATARYWLF